MSSRSSRNTPVLVSACLLGLACRYDGGSRPRDLLVELARRGCAVPACPEQLGGLATPRPAAWIEIGEGADVLARRERVVDERGHDRSEAFRRGAGEALHLARIFGCRAAVLKERSPSCGVHQLAREEAVEPGRGVAAALLAGEGIELLSDEDPKLADVLREWYEASA